MENSLYRGKSLPRRKPPADHGAPPTPSIQEEHQHITHTPALGETIPEWPLIKDGPTLADIPNLTQEDQGNFGSHINSFRSSNPNLQPLSPREKHELDSRRNRQSIDRSEVPQRPMSTQSSISTVSTVTSASTPNTSRHSVGSSADLKSKFKRFSQIPFKASPGILSTSSSIVPQGFWKYHILEFGNDLYLSTNPDSKHLYCRHSPGVHVQVLYPQIEGARERDISGNSGFRMVFKYQDDDDSEAFITVTKSQDGNEFTIDGFKRMFEDEEGSIVAIDAGTNPPSRLLITASETTINEFKARHNEPSMVKPVRFHIPVSTDNPTSWNVGSILQFKQGTSKLKNKRYIYFHTIEKDKILACFRPHESRTKKKIIKKLNSKLLPSSSFVNTDKEVLFDGKDTVYYTPGDGVFTKDPPDDAPNSDKLGWITIFDDPSLKIPGNWELALGYSLAVGFSRVLEEKADDVGVLR